MTKEEKLKVAIARLNRLQQNPKDYKCPGVIRKVQRQVRNLEK